MRHMKIDFFNDWLTPAVQKRAADMMEKTSVAAFIWAVFQDKNLGYVMAFITAFMSFALTKLLEKKE